MMAPHFEVKSPRKLLSEMESRIDDKVVEIYGAEFFRACGNKDGNAVTLMAAVAMEKMGIREQGGNNRGKLVGLIQAVIGAFLPKGDGQAWCMSFVQLCIAYAERKIGVVSKIYASESCASVRAKSPVGLSVKSQDSLPGDVWVWVYTTGSRRGLGHTGVFKAWASDKSASMLEGNTEAGLVSGKVERDGGGVYQTLRPVSIPGMKIGMVIRPFQKVVV